MSLNNLNKLNNSNEVTYLENQTIKKFYDEIKSGFIPSKLLNTGETYVVWNVNYEKKNSYYDNQIMTVGIKSGEWIIHKDMFGMKSKRFQGNLIVLHDTQGQQNQVLEYDSGYAKNRIWIKTKSGCTKLFMFKNIEGLSFI